MSGRPTLAHRAAAKPRGLTRAALFLLLTSCLGCDSPARPNVVLVVIDTLRADHVGSYGYTRATSPGLDRLAEEGARFADARAPSSWTLPSVASILTGVYPAVHGVERNTSVLGDELPTMAQAFRDAGYLTGAVSANPAFVTPGQGLARGFDEFRVLHGEPVERGGSIDTAPADPWLRSMVRATTADEVTRSALAWVTAHGSAPAPFFLYVHYFDPHAPYFPPPEYAVRFGVDPHDVLAGPAQWPLLLPLRTPAPAAPASAQVIATLTALYDAELAFTDMAVAGLVDGIRHRVPRPLLLVVTADHGEEFGDHGAMQHGRTLFDEMLRVPLILVGPGVPQATVIAQPVSIVSLWPTLASLASIAPPPRPDGPALTRLFGGMTTENSPLVFADLDVPFTKVHRRAITDGKRKLLETPDGHTRLYDLTTDPHEQEDIATADPVQARALLAPLRARDIMARAFLLAAPPATVTLTSEQRDRLHALGYLQ